MSSHLYWHRTFLSQASLQEFRTASLVGTSRWTWSERRSSCSTNALKSSCALPELNVAGHSTLTCLRPPILAKTAAAVDMVLSPQIMSQGARDLDTDRADLGKPGGRGVAQKAKQTGQRDDPSDGRLCQMDSLGVELAVDLHRVNGSS